MSSKAENAPDLEALIAEMREAVMVADTPCRMCGGRSHDGATMYSYAAGGGGACGYRTPQVTPRERRLLAALEAERAENARRRDETVELADAKAHDDEMWHRDLDEIVRLRTENARLRGSSEAREAAVDRCSRCGGGIGCVLPPECKDVLCGHCARVAMTPAAPTEDTR